MTRAAVTGDYIHFPFFVVMKEKKVLQLVLPVIMVHFKDSLD